MLRTFEYKCGKCSYRKTLLVEAEQRDSQVCECGSQMQRLFTPPNVRTAKLSASFVDGQRGQSKEFKELKRQGQLEDVLADEWASPEEQHDAKKELKSIVGEDNI